ncbi:unnamed protein product [marine sediment metagenome]|uniref:Uncharacterized protein n=1 Tax=marine sediment metagenome TaxID=412755 RepID=X1FE56_9ZZZZ
MLEVLYDITTREVRAWNADVTAQGNFNPKEGQQEVIIFPIDPPTFNSDIYYIDLANHQILPNPDYIEPYDPSLDEARLAEIVANSPDVITMPEMWEAIRILAKLHGISI